MFLFIPKNGFLLLQSGIVFGQPGMLLFGLTAVIPILIHLWSQKERHDEAWAAIQFLNEAYRQEKSRLHIHTLLLLILRVTSLLAFAVALANPKLSENQNSAFPSQRPHHDFLVLDVSYSMGLSSAQSNLFDQAKRKIERFASSQSRYGSVSLIRMGSTSDLLLDKATDADRIRQKLTHIELEESTADLEAALRLLAKLLEDTPRDDDPLRVVFFSDMQNLTWTQLQTMPSQELLKRIQKHCSISVVPIRSSNPDLDNLALTVLRSTTSLLTPSREGEFVYEIVNSNRTDAIVLVTCIFDGATKSRQQLQIPAMGSVQNSLRHRFAKAGEHTVEIRISDDDLQIDNRRYLSCFVPRSMKISIVASSEAESQYVDAAVRSASVSDDIRISFQSEFTWARQLLEPTELLFFCNIRQFTSNEAQVLRDWLHQGRTAVIFLGDQVNLENYNRVLGAEGAKILPARLGEIVDRETVFFDPKGFAHPLLAVFRGFGETALSSVPTWRYVHLQPVDRNELPVALWFSNSDPAIVSAMLGDGRILLVACSVAATSASPDNASAWTAWPLLPSFPPVMHQIVDQSMSYHQNHRNVSVGRPIGSFISAKLPLGSLKVIRQDLSPSEVSVAIDQNTYRWTYPHAKQSGFYRALFDHVSQPDMIFAANIDPRESNLATIAEGNLPDSIEVVDQNLELLSHSDENISNIDPTYRNILAIVLLLLVAESVTAWWSGRVT